MSRRSRISSVLSCLAAVLAFAPGLVLAQAPAPTPTPASASAPAPVSAPPPVLKNDPFARPALSARGAPAPSGVSSAPRVTTAPGTSWNPELTAILWADKDSLVKVGGVVLQLGEVIDGHRLVEVRESEAVFIAVQTKKRVVLSLSGGEPPPGPPLQEEPRTKERRDDSREGQGK